MDVVEILMDRDDEGLCISNKKLLILFSVFVGVKILDWLSSFLLIDLIF